MVLLGTPRAKTVEEFRIYIGQNENFPAKTCNQQQGSPNHWQLYNYQVRAGVVWPNLKLPS